MKRSPESSIMTNVAILAACSHDQAAQQREIAPYVWTHPDDDERG
jgi:hypothetical protein